MKKQITQKTKIFLAILISLVIVTLTSNVIFIANTPRLNKLFLTELINLPQTVVDNSKAFLTSLGLSQKEKNKNEAIKNLSNLPLSQLKPIAKGVYAKEDISNNIYYVRVTKDADFEERIIDYRGQKIKIRFPKRTTK